MTFIDWTILAILIISSLISLKRGFVKEALSLATWILALIIARMFSAKLAFFLTDLILSPNWRLAAAFAILFATTLVVGAMINHLLSEVIRMTGLTGTDRVLGMVFGVLRGLIIVVVLLALARVILPPEMLEGAILVKHFDPVITWTGEHIQKASQVLIDISN